MSLLADHLVSSGVHAPPTHPGRFAHLVSVLVSGAGHWICAMRGHDLLLHFERRRLSMQCTKCGWTSPGWTIDGVLRPAYGTRRPARNCSGPGMAAKKNVTRNSSH